MRWQPHRMSGSLATIDNLTRPYRARHARASNTAHRVTAVVLYRLADDAMNHSFP